MRFAFAAFQLGRIRIVTTLGRMRTGWQWRRREVAMQATRIDMTTSRQPRSLIGQDRPVAANGPGASRYTRRSEVNSFAGGITPQVASRRGLRSVRALANPGILFVLLLLVAAHAFAGGVTLAWDPVASASLAGYKVYYGPAAGNYTTSIDVGNTTSYTVSNLTEGATYHFATTAYDTAHAESAFSNDVSATFPYSAPVANFSASTTMGTAPLALNFTSTSTGSITSYAWTFGDGGTSTAGRTQHTSTRPPAPTA